MILRSEGTNFIWRNNKLTKTNLIELDWDNLITSDDLSTEEAKVRASIIDHYLSNFTTDEEIDRAIPKNITKITIDNSLLETDELILEKISNEQLFEYFQKDKGGVDSSILFPKMKRINHLFWFLHNLSLLNIQESKIYIRNQEELSIHSYQLIDSALFFGFLTRIKEEDNVYLIPTNLYEEFIKQPIDRQYPLFLLALARNETVSEVLQVQLNDPIYDNISREMVHNILAADPNIQKESLSDEEIKGIANNFRYWFLNIKKIILIKE